MRHGPGLCVVSGEIKLILLAGPGRPASMKWCERNMMAWHVCYAGLPSNASQGMGRAGGTEELAASLASPHGVFNGTCRRGSRAGSIATMGSAAGCHLFAGGVGARG